MNTITVLNVMDSVINVSSELNSSIFVPQYECRPLIDLLMFRGKAIQGYVIHKIL